MPFGGDAIAVALASPLPDGERSDCEAIRVRGLWITDRPVPLTPALSPMGRGGERAVPDF
jgi:hypothetical protein